MTGSKRFSLIKPTIYTPFHIDFDWWKQNDTDWHVHLLGCLCQEHQASFSNLGENQSVDWVDPLTGEVQSVDRLQHILMTHCAKEPNFLTNYTTLVDAVFRVLLANGNTPLTPVDLAALTGKSADIILRTLAGSKVYKGLRPMPLSMNLPL
jgi:hypothetical protein